MGALFSWAEKNFRMFRGKGNCGRRERGRWEEVTAMHEERRARGDREGPWAECDLCGGELVTRKDDATETVKNRLKVFHAETEPLKDFYKKLGNLKLVEGNQPIEHATRDILAALGE